VLSDGSPQITRPSIINDDRMRPRSRSGSSSQPSAAANHSDCDREKFGEDAARMYFTPEGLEQATRRPVAAHRAARLTAASTRTVVDLGCGIGGDLMATARAGIIFGNDGLSGGFRWDAAPRTMNGLERSLNGGLRYSVQGGSFQATAHSDL